MSAKNPPGATQYTEYASGDGDQIITMSPRRDVPPASAFSRYEDELSPAERERVRQLPGGVRPDLPRHKCRNFARCKFAFAQEAKKLEHELYCDEQLKRGAEQHAKGDATSPDAPDAAIPFVIPETESAFVTKAEVKGMLGEFMSELKGLLGVASQPAKNEETPDARPAEPGPSPEEDRPESQPEVGSTFKPLGPLPSESDPSF